METINDLERCPITHWNLSASYAACIEIPLQTGARGVLRVNVLDTCRCNFAACRCCYISCSSLTPPKHPPRMCWICLGFGLFEQLSQILQNLWVFLSLLQNSSHLLSLHSLLHSLLKVLL